MTKTSRPSFYNLIGLTYLLFVVCSCSKTDLTRESSDNNLQSPSSTKTTSKSSTIAPVYLSVLVDDAAPNKITSDVKGAYVHGVDNVSAYFDEYGNLQFDTNPAANVKRQPVALRWLNFTFNDPVDGYSSVTMANITTNPKGNYRMVTQPEYNGQTPAQNLVGSQRIRLGGGFSDGTSTDWNFSFQYNQVQNTSFATITRKNNDTWEITGEITETYPLPVARLKKSDGTVVGFYKLPFKLTLTRNL